MIANFFQSLSARGVEYLLISGQATILYGAATFSEDIDLWINPTVENRDRFLAALRGCKARYYKLTPQVSVENLAHGHGFHFLLPGGDQPDVFLDIMGKPPRVGAFAACVPSARLMETEWGLVRTIGLKALVELKKTQRLEDYPIISKLVLAWFDQPERAETPDDLVWALRNIFTLPELRIFFLEHHDAIRLPPRTLNTEIKEFAGALLSEGESPEPLERRIGEQMQTRIADLQQADRRYWRNIILELKAFRSTGKLMVEGSLVR